MRIRRPLCIALTILTALIWMLAPVAQGMADAETTVRVGYFAFSGYHMLDEDGRRSGYGYEFLQKLATHTDWVYDYIGYESSYADALDMLRAGEVDIVTSVSYTPERAEEFLFSRQNIGTNSTIFTVKAGNRRVVEGDYATYDGLKIGMLEGNSKNAYFERFAAEHDFTYNPVYFGTQDELNEALQQERVDGVVSGSLRALENEWMIESFDASPFYICTRKDNVALMTQIDEAIDEMDLHEPDWRNELHEKYYATDTAGMIVLNGDERAYLERLVNSGVTLTVLVNADRAPYAYFRDGEARGIFPGVFELLAARLGLSYRFVECSGGDDYFALRSEGGADIVLDFPSDYYMAERQGYKITDAYFHATFTRLTRSSFTGSVQKVATMPGTDMLEGYVGRFYAPEQIIYYDTADECVQAVMEGDVDATVLHSYMAERFVREDERNQLNATLMGETSLSYSIGVRAADGYLLLSMLNKAVHSLSETELNAVVAQEVEDARGDTTVSLIAFLYNRPVYALIATALVLLLLFALAMLAVRTRNQHALKRKVEQATSDLQARTQELSEALRAADAANRAKTTFLNNMSHDIRTPMNAIIGFTALATTHLDNRERAEDYLGKIAQASNHLLSLINDVLDMSRIESGKVTIEERPENLADILQGLRNIIQSDVHAKRLELFIDTVDVTDEEVFCDKLRLNQILLNLTSNAIKFTKAGGSVSIQVTQKPCDEPEHGIYEFRVKDTGIGMSPEFAATVFEPFTRERNSTVSGIQGTGLGMAITKNIVEMMHGAIEVHSEQGVGTEFTVTLKLRFTTEHRDMGPIVELSGFRALVVDDDMVSCQSVSKMLRHIGMRAEWTLSGREAVVRTEEALELSDPFEVYIVDWAMPEMDGVETVRRIRRIVGDESPIILMSAYDWADIETEARNAGVTGFISKPLFASDLHRALERGLGHGRAESERDKGQEIDVFRGRRILLAEDNELNREIAVELLGEAGLTIECAENGQVACDMVEAAAPGYYDLVLMDIQMPIMDGYEATHHIRAMADPERAAVPIIAMTANAFEEDRERALEAGMNGHLAKPIDVEKMMTLLENILK